MKQHLALFDLDHTLLPMDSDYQWVNFLSDSGKIFENPEQVKHQNEQIMEYYNQGKLTIEESSKFMLGFLAKYTPYDLAKWHEEFMRKIIRPAITKEAINLVRTHLESGGLCAIVTSTNSFVTAPIARAFGIQTLIATVPEFLFGRYTGKIHGVPSFKQGKVIRVSKWLKNIGKNLEDFSKSFFYTDSMNDISLLEIVSNPIATNPSSNLRELALNKGWDILYLFNKKENI